MGTLLMKYKNVMSQKNTACEILAHIWKVFRLKHCIECRYCIWSAFLADGCIKPRTVY
jgi:hypothetical protein